MVNVDGNNIFNVYRHLLSESANKRKGVTLEQRLRLEGLKRQLGKKIPLFHTFINKVPVIFSYNMPTMAVDNFDNLYINPDFFDSLTDTGVITVLAHEMYHVFSEHVSDAVARGMNGTLHNFATDYAINRDLDKDGLNIRNILKNKSQFAAVTPLKHGNKYYIKIDNDVIDVTNSTAYEIYYLLAEEARKRNLKVQDLVDKINQQHGKPHDQHDPKNIDKAPPQPKKQIYKVGDKIKDLSSKITGKVVSVTPPDENGEQMLDIDWDIPVKESTYRYIIEAVAKGIPSSSVMLSDDEGEQQPQPPKSGKPEQQPPGESKPQDKNKDTKEKGEQEEGGKPESGEKQRSEEPQGEGEGGVGDDIIEGPVKPRTEKISSKEKREAKKKEEITKREAEKILKSGKGDGFEVTGEKHVDWGVELRDILVKSVEYVSTLMPDYRSTGMGRYIRGRTEVKQKVVVTAMVDTSGSVSKSMYTKFMNELLSIVDSISMDSELNIIMWASKVYSTEDQFHIDPSDTGKLQSVPFQTGGTNFGSAIKFYKDHESEIGDTNIIIVFTDGEFNGERDYDKDLLNQIPEDIKIVFTLFQPSYRGMIDNYQRSNISVIETNIRA